MGRVFPEFLHAGNSVHPYNVRFADRKILNSNFLSLSELHLFQAQSVVTEKPDENLIFFSLEVTGSIFSVSNRFFPFFFFLSPIILLDYVSVFVILAG